MNKLSVIMPFVNEWPQIAFTIRSIYEQLNGRIDFEIIAIDNFCLEVEEQGRKPDRGHNHLDQNGNRQQGHIDAMSNKHKWLKVVKYYEKLSHWNSKNLGVRESTGDVLLFVDAHTIASDSILVGMYRYFVRHSDYFSNGNNFTLHAPLAYHILENKPLIYKLVYEPEKGVVHYRFMNMPDNISTHNEVPCMSTCGMMMSREYYDFINGWPEGLGIYGGGENYLNFYSSILGTKKFIYPYGILYHHGDKRGYNWNWEDYHRNRMIATCMYGDNDMLLKYQQSIGCNQLTDRMMRQAVRSCEIHRMGNKAEDNKIKLIHDWVEEWENKDFR